MRPRAASAADAGSRPGACRRRSSGRGRRGTAAATRCRAARRARCAASERRSSAPGQSARGRSAQRGRARRRGRPTVRGVQDVAHLGRGRAPRAVERHGERHGHGVRREGQVAGLGRERVVQAAGQRRDRRDRVAGWRPTEPGERATVGPASWRSSRLRAGPPVVAAGGEARGRERRPRARSAAGRLWRRVRSMTMGRGRRRRRRGSACGQPTKSWFDRSRAGVLTVFGPSFDAPEHLHRRHRGGDLARAGLPAGRDVRRQRHQLRAVQRGRRARRAVPLRRRAAARPGSS